METNNQNDQLKQIEEGKSDYDRFKRHLSKCDFPKLWPIKAILAVAWLALGIYASHRASLRLPVFVAIFIVMVAWAISDVFYCSPVSRDKLTTTNPHLKQDLFSFKKHSLKCSFIFLPVTAALLVWAFLELKSALYKSIVHILEEPVELTSWLFVLFLVTTVFLIIQFVLAFHQSRNINMLVEEIDGYQSLK
ncbi:MAG: hypothetical protein IKT00_05720 [Prevotella sp.]|nr:hypothetical protein [Prevotella sp.]